MYTQSLNSGGRAAQRLNQHFYTAKAEQIDTSSRRASVASA
jgi:hypothetical protein